MRSSVGTGCYASRAWAYFSLLISFLRDLLAARDVPAQFFEYVVAGANEPVLFDGFENSSGSRVQAS